jgi:integrase
MTRIRLDCIHEYHDRHGRLRRYVRRPGSRRVPLPGIPGSPEFMQTYSDAMSGATVSVRARRHKAGTLGAVAADFLQSAEFANLKPSSQASYRKALNPILERDGHRLARDLPRDKARKIIQEIGERRPGMANLTRAVLRRLFAYAIDVGLRRDNPFERSPAYKLGTHHSWTDAELAAFEKRWPLGTRERLAYALLLFTGQRGGDVVKMRRSDIRNGTIHVVQSKTGAELYVKLHPALVRAIKAGPAKGLYLIGEERSGRPVNRAALTHLMKRAARLAGLPARCLPHGLRKAALRRLAEHGSTSKQIQAVSGHRSLREIERYTRQADQQRLAEAAIGQLPDKD